MIITHYNQSMNQYNPSFKKLDAATVKKTIKQTKHFINNKSDRATSYLAFGIGKMASYKPVQKVVDWFKDKNYQAHLAAIVGCILSGFYMIDTAKSKTIEKDQKLPLILNQGVVCAFSTLGAYTLNNYLDKKINNIYELFSIAKIEDKKLQEHFLKFKANPEYADVVERAALKNNKLKELFKKLEKKFEFTNNTIVFIKDELKKSKDDAVAKSFLKEIKNIDLQGRDKSDVLKELFFKRMNKSNVLKKVYNRESMNNTVKLYSELKQSEKLSNLLNGFKTAKALMIFALIYRFVSPVVATPIANKFSEKFEAKKKDKLNTAA